MKDGSLDGLLIHLQIRQYDGHAQRMDNVRLPGFALLLLMGLGRHLVCLLNHADIIGRVIPAYPFN